jgi:hypothetical protein
MDHQHLVMIVTGVAILLLVEVGHPGTVRAARPRRSTGRLVLDTLIVPAHRSTDPVLAVEATSVVRKSRPFMVLDLELACPIAAVADPTLTVPHSTDQADEGRITTMNHHHHDDTTMIGQIALMIGQIATMIGQIAIATQEQWTARALTVSTIAVTGTERYGTLTTRVATTAVMVRIGATLTAPRATLMAPRAISIDLETTMVRHLLISHLCHEVAMRISDATVIVGATTETDPVVICRHQEHIESETEIAEAAAV